MRSGRMLAEDEPSRLLVQYNQTVRSSAIPLDLFLIVSSLLEFRKCLSSAVLR